MTLANCVIKMNSENQSTLQFADRMCLQLQFNLRRGKRKKDIVKLKNAYKNRLFHLKVLTATVPESLFYQTLDKAIRIAAAVTSRIS
jgi:hypothetical protein